MNSIDLTFIALLISFAGIILNFIYSRREIEIMKAELNIFRVTWDKKKKLEETSIKIRESIKLIKKNLNMDEIYAIMLYDAVNEIVIYMHDNKTEEITSIMTPIIVEMVTLKGRTILPDPEYAITCIKNSVIANDVVRGGSVTFSMTPDIVSNHFFMLTDIFYTISNIYEAFLILDDIRNLIDTFDSNIMDDLNGSISEIFLNLINPFFKHHKINFKSNDKSEDILFKLKNEVIGIDNLQANLNFLTNELFNKRLSLIGKEMFLQS